MELINLFDFEAEARKKMDPTHFEFYAGGAAEEITLKENRTRYDDLRLRPRVLAGTGSCDQSTSILGAPVEMPLVVAPAAMAKLAHEDGELGIARAARQAGVIQCLSTLSNDSLEAVADTGARVWLQLYILRDRSITTDLLARAASAGYEAIVLTVDAPVAGLREGARRTGLRFPPGMVLGNIAGPGNTNAEQVVPYVQSLLDSSLTWSDLEWLASSTPLTVIVKGVLRGDDARRAVDHGAKAIIVSNHGGRQLDTAIAGIDALPEVVSAVGAETEVYVDGGIRRGTDIIKALALGARAVLAGRPLSWGLAVDGERGVSRVLEIVRSELATAMALCGCSSLADITADLLAREVPAP